MGINQADSIKLKTHYRVTLLDAETGGVIERKEFDNILTDAFLTRVLNRLGSAGTDTIGYLAIGTGTGTPTASDTALVTELTRKAITWSVSGAVATGIAFFGNAEANGTLTECGLIDAAASGTLMSHALFTSSISKTSSRWLQVDITITAARG